MKKSKKLFLLSCIFVFVFFVYFTLSSSAETITINNVVPYAQQYGTLVSRYKTQNSNHGDVSLTLKEPAAVTFSARAKKSDGTWGAYQAGVVVDRTGQLYSVPYEYNLAAGTIVQARFRNHNWSMKSEQIEGTFDYK